MDDVTNDKDRISQQIPHTQTAKGGFTNGRRLQHVRSEIQRSVQMYPERPPETLDCADREIEAAIREDRQIRLDRAFPDTAKHPRGTKNSHLPSGTKDTPMNRGANPHEPGPEISPFDETSSPAGKLARVQHDHPRYAKVYRLALMHCLTMRGLPLGQIGALLGITTRQVQSLRVELIKRIKKEAEHADILAIAGETQAFYDEIRAICMRMASEATEASECFAAIRTALSAETDKHRFLQASGFYDIAKYIPKSNT